jgi:hypothetical protein
VVDADLEGGLLIRGQGNLDDLLDAVAPSMQGTPRNTADAVFLITVGGTGQNARFP